MKQIVFFGLMLLSALSVAGQTQVVDSLEQVLETQKLTAEELLKVYDVLCEKSVYNDQERFRKYVAKGLALADKEKNKELVVKFTSALGIYYIHKSSYDTAIVHLEKALLLAEDINDKQKEADICGNLAGVYCNKGDLETGISYYHKSISILERNGLDKNLAIWYGNMGGRYRQLGEYNLAIKYLEKAEQLGIKNNDLNALAKAYSAFGNLYLEMEDMDKAMEYGLKSLKVSQEMNNKQGETYAYQVLINVSLTKEEYDEAEKYANECLRVSEEMNYARGMSMAWNALANIHLEKGRYKEAEMAAFKALETDSTNLYLSTGILAHISIANIFLGNKEKAVAYLHKSFAAKDEFNNNSVRESLMEMETKYETEKKELRITSLEKEQQLYVWLGIAGALLAIALGVALWQKGKNVRKEKQLIATSSVLDGEMKERTRLAQDLHDRLSGNLSAVKLELNNYAESLQSVCAKLDNCIEDIRNVAHDLMPTSLQYGMKVALEDFAAQFPNVAFHFFGKEKRIDKRTEFVVYCCASELVNNSIKHANAKNINLQLVQAEKHVSLTVQDDGCGFNEESVAKGFGLKSIRDRVASSNGKIDIDSAPGKGTETTIELRIKN
ncbi:MAG: tetratricopeptide repeat protein [Dysgonamonadaceae bacterium]|jgi:signal transduction histidine kinase|nr:tetratricopeptide repeat protein [Dysgonamonadaceae bacterium]